MRTIVIITLILLLLTGTVYGNSLDRVRYAEFDGEIDFISITGSNVARSGVKIQGEGQVIIDDTISGTNNSLQTELDLMLQSSPSWYDEPLEAIVVTQVLNGNDQPLTYANYLRPDRGEAARIQQKAQVELDLFALFEIDTEVSLSGGRYRNFINLYNTEAGLSLYEMIDFMGQMYMLDMIQFSIELEEVN